MKKNLLLMLLFAILLGFLAGVFYKLHETQDQGDRILFQRADERGDDYGPGTYIYPTHDHFEPHEGLFDLLGFKVARSGGYYQFLLTFGHINNPWRARYGFSHQLIQIYIDNEPGGSLTTLVPGANVAFYEKNPWNYLIKASGWGADLYQVGDDPDETSREDGLSIHLLEEENTILIQVPIEKLGPLESASYYVLIGSFDIFGKDNYREVEEEVGTWNLGGGSNTPYNPNVMDILTPKNACQKEILGSYAEEEGRFAVLYPVGDRRDLLSFMRTAGIFGLFILLLLLFFYLQREKRHW